MVIYRQLSVTVRTIFGIYTLLLLIPALYMWIGSLITDGTLRSRILTFVPAAAGVVTFQGISDVEVILKGSGRCSLMGRAAGNMPWIGLIMWLIFLTAVITGVGIYRISQKNKNISQESLRESLDMLPDGVCFYTDDGFPILVNITMNRLCGEIFGRGIMNGSRIWEDIREERGKDGIKFTDFGQEVSVMLRDNSVWNFQRKRILADDREFWELTACDITKEYSLNRELEMRGRQLARNNERLREFSRNVKKVTRNEEILAAKMKVHDEIGRSLLQMRFWLGQGAHRKDAAELMNTWEFIADQMKHGGPMDNVENTDSIAEIAGNLHVTLIRQGEFPAGRGRAEVIIKALKECMNNTVKHAGGKSVCFSSWEEKGEYHACFTNDGASPDSEIQEKGGLKNLRLAVEEQGGSMKITSQPSFRLEIIFPEEVE